MFNKKQFILWLLIMFVSVLFPAHESYSYYEKEEEIIKSIDEVGFKKYDYQIVSVVSAATSCSYVIVLALTQA
jgi:hypothetical protein